MTPIVVDIHNDPDILQVFVDSIPFIPGWKVQLSGKPGNKYWQKYPNRTARYFLFNSNHLSFSWFTSDDHPPDECQRIKDVADASKFMDHIYQMSTKHYGIKQ